MKTHQNHFKKRRRCVVCRCLTEKWQRVNFGPYHCYDDCRSTQAKYLHYRNPETV